MSIESDTPGEVSVDFNLHAVISPSIWKSTIDILYSFTVTSRSLTTWLANLSTTDKFSRSSYKQYVNAKTADYPNIDNVQIFEMHNAEA